MLADRMRRFGATSIVTVTAVGLLAAPASADPAPAPAVGIGAVHTASTRDSLTVPVWTDHPGAVITAVDASLTFAGRTVDLPLTDPDGDGRYAPASPVTVGGTLPSLGHWAVSVTATDSTADTATRADAGVFDFTDRPVLDPAELHATTTSHAHPDATLSGTAYVLTPGSTTPDPAVSRTVTVTRPASGTADAVTQTVTTGTDGRFTTAPFTEGGGATYTVAFAASDDDVDGAASAQLDAPVDYSNSTVTLTAAASHARVSDGKSYTVSGTATLGKAAVVGIAVRVRSSALSGPGLLVTTQKGGRFSATLRAVAAGNAANYWYADVVDRYLSGSTSGVVAVPAPATYSGVRIVLASTGRVTATGTIGYAYPTDAVGVTYQEVTYLESSPNGRTGWTALARVTSAGGTGETFSVSGPGYVDAWYRVRHVQSDALEATTSAAVHRSRLRTYVFANNATPEPVTKGRTVTVTGTLKEYRSRAWRALGHRTIYLYFEARGAKQFGYVRTGTTDARGRVRLSAPASRDGYWSLHYFGDSKHFDSGSSPDYVDVR